MEEAIIVTDLDGNITDWNPASERMFGYSKSEILGKSAFILTQTRKGQQLDQGPVEVLREGDVWKGEYEFVHSDGSVGVVFTVFALLKDDQGIRYGTVGLCHDLTKRKRLEERLTAKSQELQEKNLALNTLLRHAEEERVRACEQVAADLTRRVAERAHHILEGKNNPQAVENHATLLLQELLSSFQSKETEKDNPGLRLSEKEREVAKLIRLGKTTEEIAFILEKSPDTIRLQRISIRKKLSLTRRDRNLAAYLRKIDLS
jgi:PAS domain S-box-containing protein